MGGLSSLLAYLRDPKLAAHATSALPVWLWSADATRVLWANPIAAAIFDADSPAALAGHVIDPKGSAALQIARVAVTLPQGAAPRLERLRGFGANFGRALMCACSRIVLEDRTPGVLVAAAEPAGVPLPLTERVRRLCTGIDEPIAFFFSTDGALLHATAAGDTGLRGLKSIAALGADKLAGEALASGRASGRSHVGEVSIERVGSDASAVLVVVFSQAAEHAKPVVRQPIAAQQDVAQPVPAAPAAELNPAASVPPAAEMTKAQAAPPERRQRLRFVWQMDAEGRSTIDSEEFVALIGPRSTALLGRPWGEIAGELDLDPDGQVIQAIASHDTWSGITVAFPVDDIDQRVQVELSGLPVFDRERNLRGYRGFGICRDAAQIAALVQAQRSAQHAVSSPKHQADAPQEADAPEIEALLEPRAESNSAKPKFEPRHEPPAIRQERPMLTVVPPVENVLPFRASEPNEKTPSLTPVERRAFRELASKLTARLREAQNGDISAATPDDALPEPAEAPASTKAVAPRPETAGRTNGGDPRPILDRLPLGVLVYRLDRLLYANRAFLDWTGYDSIHALADAGGLDALFIEPGSDVPGPNGAKSLSITTSHGSQVPIEARLFSTPWDGESALVLMLAGPAAEERKPSSGDKPPDIADSEARELRSVLDIATDGVVLLDRDGRVLSINRGAEELFGYQSRELAGLPFAGLFAPESQRTAFDYLDRVNRSGTAGVLDESCEVLGRGRETATIPLLLTMGKIAGSEKLVAVFRNLVQWKSAEEDLRTAKQHAERASSAKSDFLAKISHEIRTPLNAIIGFSEVMIDERFGPVGNDRYRQYLKDIRTSGEHLISLLNDLLDLSKIEAGKLDLNFTRLDLNELVQQCVALMQPQANRERIIIRTALSSSLPSVLADARSVRQIALNLLSNSIKFTTAGGQVIVSTALNDSGEVVLRVRDTGPGMSEKEIAVALEPFRQLATSVRFGSGGTGLGLPLTKALAEANRATFRIKSAVNAGTLIEVAFPGTPIAAE